MRELCTPVLLVVTMDHKKEKEHFRLKVQRVVYCCVILIKLYMLLVPDNWATIEITNLTQGGALHQHNYSLMCTVQAIWRMNITLQVYWYSSDGSIIKTGGRFKVDTVNKNGSITTLSLSSPVLHDDGGVYSCKAQVTVPWMTTQPPVKQASVNVVVTSKLSCSYLHMLLYDCNNFSITAQAMFQLRMGPLTHCSTLFKYFFFHLSF